MVKRELSKLAFHSYLISFPLAIMEKQADFDDGRSELFKLAFRGKRLNTRRGALAYYSSHPGFSESLISRSIKFISFYFIQSGIDALIVSYIVPIYIHICKMTIHLQSENSGAFVVEILRSGGVRVWLSPFLWKYFFYTNRPERINWESPCSLPSHRDMELVLRLSLRAQTCNEK